MTLLKILIALLVFGFLILIHEFGHYLTARLFRVGIREFSIGMGPKLVSVPSQKTGIAYSLRALPIGGYVSMGGEDEESDRDDAFGKKPIWQRFIILIAGSVMNLLLGVILTCGLVVSSGHLYSTTVTGFAEGATSAVSGLREGDTVVAIGKTKVSTLYDMSYVILRSGTGPIDVTVRRNGQRVVIRGVTFPTTTEEGITFGLRDFTVNEEEKTLGAVVRHSIVRSVTSVRMIWESLFDLVTGKYGIAQMSGPVGITKEIGDAAVSGDGGTSLFTLTALIALNLGVVNLLPFPALDGGRVVFLLIEAVRGKPMKKETEGYIHFAGMALLLLLMLIVTFSDVSKLIR